MGSQIWQSGFLNRRTVAVLCLSFSSGLPLVLVGSTLQAWYTMAGVNLLAIGTLTLIGQPYIFKFLWAPFLDRFVPFAMGRRRSWILLTQGMLVLGLVWMAFLSPSSTPWLLASVALMVAFFSATQDIAFDAYRTDVLLTNELGIGASLTAIGARVAILISGALALILVAKIGWQAVYLLMAALMLCGMFATYFAPNPFNEVKVPRSLKEAVLAPITEFMSRRNALALLIFIAVYKLCDAMAMSLNTTFLIRGLGFSLAEIGAITKVVGLTAVLVGSFVGGLLLPALGLYRALFYFGLLQMFSNLSFALLSAVGKSYWLMGSAIFAENFCAGLGTVAFIVFLMSLCDKRFTATQYAFFSALMALGRVFVGPEAAVMVKYLGWTNFYISTFFIGVPALILLWWLNRRVNFDELQWVNAE